MALNPVDAMDAPLDRRWTADALCHEYADLDWFGESVAAVEACSAVCRRCPVRAECWQYALNVRPSHGTWAGVCLGPSRRASRPT